MSELRKTLSEQAHEQFAVLNAAAETLGCPPISLEMGSRQFALAAATIAAKLAARVDERLEELERANPSLPKR